MLVPAGLCTGQGAQTAVERQTPVEGGGRQGGSGGPGRQSSPSSTKSLMLESLCATRSAPGYCWGGGSKWRQQLEKTPGVLGEPGTG